MSQPARQPSHDHVQADGGSTSESDARRGETSLERLDRNLDEMMGELRVVVTGVQVLFAFLLIVPFNSGFVGIGPFERTVYLVTLICSALAALCVIMPAAYHRILFRQDDKRHVVLVANQVTLVGLVLLAVAMCGSVLLVTTKLYGATAGAITAALVAAAFAVLWFIAPLVRRAAHDHVAAGAGDRVRDVRPVSARAAVEPREAAIGVLYDSPVGAQEHLSVDARREQDRVVLRLEGELDLASSPVLERALEGSEIAETPLLVLDLDGLRFVDSTGLRIILLAHESARGRGQEFAITPGSPQVQRLLSITSVAEHMRVIASPDDLLV